MAKDINELLSKDVDAIVARGQENYKRSRKRVAVALVAFFALCILAVVAYIVVQQVQLWQKYDQAVQLVEAGQYDESIAMFEELGNYKNSADMILETKYTKATALMKDKRFGAAIAIFEELGDYSDSGQQAELARKRYNELTSEQYNEELGKQELYNCVGKWAFSSGNRNLIDSKNSAETLEITVGVSKIGSHDANLKIIFEGEHGEVRKFFYFDSGTITDGPRKLTLLSEDKIQFSRDDSTCVYRRIS